MATSTSTSLRVLFVDDEKSLQEFMRSELPRLGHEVTVCHDGKQALKVLEKGKFDAAILDLRMPGMSGIEVLEHLKAVSPDTEAVVMTGHASMETAIDAVRLGAFDYITKPCKLAEIEALLRRIAEKRDLQNQTLALESRVKATEGPTILVGDSPAMQAVHRIIATVAPTDATVLITGETGTGKELAARAVWMQSLRGDAPFVPVNCGSLNDQLAESELFGHRKGAFTTALSDHKGMFEVGNGGSVFLDELGELSRGIQVKLLRFLESGEIRRVGDNEPFRINVRVICATNRNLLQMIRDEVFREDLYFRLNTFEIRLPPLRERRPDIPALARHLLARAARRPFEQVADLLSPETIDVLLEHDWPGNVRELANIMEYAHIISGGKLVTPDHLPQRIRTPAGVPRGASAAPSAGTPAATIPFDAAGAAPLAPARSGPRTLEEVEMEHILQVLAKHNGHKVSAAAELGISLKTLYNKLNKEEQRRAAG